MSIIRRQSVTGNCSTVNHSKVLQVREWELGREMEREVGKERKRKLVRERGVGKEKNMVRKRKK